MGAEPVFDEVTKTGTHYSTILVHGAIERGSVDFECASVVY